VKRREFITLLGGAAIARPLAASAQQLALPAIGLLDPRSPDADSRRLRGFREGLKDNGYVEGESVTIVYRWAENQTDRLPDLAAALVRRQVAVIAATGGGHVIIAAKAATTTIPIVSIFSQDPVQLGLVSSLARPGGNLTGINFFGGELPAKRLGFLRELVPDATRIAVLVNLTDATIADATVRGLEAAASVLGVHINVLKATDSHQIDVAFATIVRERHEALVVASGSFFASRRVQLANLSVRHGIPLVYGSREYAEVGGLISYGTDLVDAFRQVGTYAGRILKGAKPADLPVLQSTKFELVINAQTARMLGLTVPQSLLAIADEVIE
jgi:putative ABC transport system substrate-binding protein